MKTSIDSSGRKVYRFSHSVRQGGHLYAHKLTSGRIADRAVLREALDEISRQFGLIDVTILVYDTIFFLFFMMGPSVAPQKLFDALQEKISTFGEWDGEHLWTGVYDLQEKHIRKEIEKLGFYYDRGR